MTVSAGDGRSLEALARFCLRNPVSLARLRWEPGSEAATYLPQTGHDGEKAETLEALDFVARLGTCCSLSSATCLGLPLVGGRSA